MGIYPFVEFGHREAAREGLNKSVLKLFAWLPGTGS